MDRVSGCASWPRRPAQRAQRPPTPNPLGRVRRARDRHDLVASLAERREETLGASRQGRRHGALVRQARRVLAISVDGLRRRGLERAPQRLRQGRDVVVEEAAAARRDDLRRRRKHARPALVELGRRSRGLRRADARRRHQAPTSRVDADAAPRRRRRDDAGPRPFVRGRLPTNASRRRAPGAPWHGRRHPPPRPARHRASRAVRNVPAAGTAGATRAAGRNRARAARRAQRPPSTACRRRRALEEAAYRASLNTLALSSASRHARAAQRSSLTSSREPVLGNAAFHACVPSASRGPRTAGRARRGACPPRRRPRTRAGACNESNQVSFLGADLEEQAQLLGVTSRASCAPRRPPSPRRAAASRGRRPRRSVVERSPLATSTVIVSSPFFVARATACCARRD